MARSAALVISACTSPFIVIAVTAALLVLRLHPSPRELAVWAGICLVCGAGLPFLFVFWLWRRGHVTDVHVAIRKQRSVPFVAALVSMAIGVAALYVVQAPRELVALGCVYLVVGLVLTLVSLWWKISVHSAVLATCAVALGLLGYPAAWVGLLGVPLVLWARAYRQRHTVLQGLVPALLGVILTPLAYWTALALLPGP